MLIKFYLYGFPPLHKLPHTGTLWFHKKKFNPSKSKSETIIFNFQNLFKQVQSGPTLSILLVWMVIGNVNVIVHTRPIKGIKFLENYCLVSFFKKICSSLSLSTCVFKSYSDILICDYSGTKHKIYAQNLWWMNSPRAEMFSSLGNSFMMHLGRCLGTAKMSLVCG
ncbi:uncharacterized protein VP01_1821g4 [Puccinia sorghi]|uniref:Uncharacterized protein n=1 Tax=Puccinia sorghi TaxID=27349 RepID=A0A0L6VFW7_9BASI|nr:uncharacterized protein VP01_1821g4 [Puccinia sorghi]